MSERVTITLDGRPLGLDEVSRIPARSAAELLSQLSTLQMEVAAGVCHRLCGVEDPDEVRLGEGSDPSAEGKRRRRGASTEAGLRGMDPHPTVGSEGPEPERTYLSVKEAAEKLGVSRSMLYHWIESGKLNEARGLRRLGARRLLIDWNALREALDRGELE